MEDGVSMLLNQWRQCKYPFSSDACADSNFYRRVLSLILLLTNALDFRAGHLRQAGTSSELEIDEKQFICAPCKFPFLLLPSGNMGPDLFYASEQDERTTVYAIAYRSEYKMLDLPGLQESFNSLSLSMIFMNFIRSIAKTGTL
jgi:hypothetical protein